MNGVATACGPTLCREMRESTYFRPIISTLLRERSVSNEAEARNLLDAFLQWIALIPVVERGKVFVMLKTPVDEVFHAFVLNTAFYQEFCQKYFGFFIHHNPLDGDTSAKIDEGVNYTVDLLEQHYGEQLHPELRAWRGQVE